MVNEVTDETMFSIDEERKVLIGQRTTVEEFDVIEIPQQIEARKQVIKNLQKQTDDCKVELDQINKHSKIFEKWEKQRIEEQKKAVAKEDKNTNSKPVPKSTPKT